VKRSRIVLTKEEFTPLCWSTKLKVVLTDLRLIPRLMVLGYGWMMYEVTMWFMDLDSPATQQAALVTTVFGASAAIFGLYTNSGDKK
jgi:hypothetical protein